MDYHSPPTSDGTGSLAPFAERDPGSDPPRLREGEEVEITRKEKKGTHSQEPVGWAKRQALRHTYEERASQLDTTFPDWA